MSYMVLNMFQSYDIAPLMKKLSHQVLTNICNKAVAPSSAESCSVSSSSIKVKKTLLETTNFMKI